MILIFINVLKVYVFEIKEFKIVQFQVRYILELKVEHLQLRLFLIKKF